MIVVADPADFDLSEGRNAAARVLVRLGLVDTDRRSVLEQLDIVVADSADVDGRDEGQLDRIANCEERPVIVVADPADFDLSQGCNAAARVLVRLGLVHTDRRSHQAAARVSSTGSPAARSDRWAAVPDWSARIQWSPKTGYARREGRGRRTRR